MSKVAIVTDSTAYIPDDLLKKYAITVTPQIVIWGEESFRDGVDITPDQFYKRLENAKVMPTTSQVSIMDMKTTFEALVGQGYEVLGIFLSAKLSGTMQSAEQALKMLPGMAEKISIVDSNSTAMAMGFHVLTVARAAQAGEILAGMPQTGRRSPKTYRRVFYGGYAGIPPPRRPYWRGPGLHGDHAEHQTGAGITRRSHRAY